MSRTDALALSIIIPTLNEDGNLSRTLASIPVSPRLEIWVTDGGSSDSTAEVARQAGARFLSGAPPRAAQMNRAAEQAGGRYLLFLHADTQLPAGFEALVERCLESRGTVVGAFRLSIDAPGWGLRWIERAANWRSRRLASPYGDQALFLRRETFEQLGGYRSIPIMEDYDLVVRARRLGRVVILDQSIRTSGRRWLRLGVLRTTFLNWVMVAGFHLGVPPARLAVWYRGAGSRRTVSPDRS